MKVSHEKPPIWDECVKKFGLENIEKAVFPYGDILYNPSKGEVPDHLEVHESVHMGQQQHDEHVASVWWKRYIEDITFRIEQEAEAYGAQYRFICEKQKDRNVRFKILYQLAGMFSGPMYGKMISHSDAVTRIRQASGMDRGGKTSK